MLDYVVAVTTMQASGSERWVRVGMGASLLGIVTAAVGAPVAGGVLLLGGWAVAGYSLHRFGRGH